MASKKQDIATHASIPDDFYDMDTDAQLEFVDQLLRGMSPNQNVRATAGRKAGQQKKKG